MGVVQNLLADENSKSVTSNLKAENWNLGDFCAANF